MKQILFIALLLGMAVAPILGIAAEPVPEGVFRLPTAGTGEGQVPATGADLLSGIQLIANWVFAIFLAISLIYIILGAFQFVTAGADPAKIQQAREKLIFAVIGIAIGLLVFGIPQIIKSIVV